MRRLLIFLPVLFLLSNYSTLMMNMMIKRMDEMPDKEKKEMMIKMMNTEEGNPCLEMMEKESGTILDDNLSMAEKASVMLPLCASSILMTVEDEMKAQYLASLIKTIISNGYCTLPVENKQDFKQEIIQAIEDL